MSRPGFLSSLLQIPASRVMLDANTGRWYTRGEVSELVSPCAQSLLFPKKALGFLFASNDAESLIAYLSCIESGNAVVMLDPELDASLKSNLIARFQPDFILAVDPGAGHQIWAVADERPLKVAWMKRFSSKRDVLVLGSSRAMEISSTWFRPRSFFKAAVRFGGIDDSVAMFELCVEKGITPDLIILEVSPGLVSYEISAKDWRPLAPYFERALNRYQLREPYQRTFKDLASYPQVRNSRRALFGVSWGLPSRMDDEKYQMLPDGQMLYPRSDLTLTAHQINKRVSSMIEAQSPASFAARTKSRPDGFELDLFHRFLDDLRSRNIGVVVFLAPIHPIAYEYFHKRGGFDDQWIKSDMASRGIRVIGSYSPYAAGAKEADFFDDVHPRLEINKRLFEAAGVIEDLRQGANVLDASRKQSLPVISQHPSDGHLMAQRTESSSIETAGKHQ